MPRKRRPDQGPPVPRIRTACSYCKVKRLKCSEDRPCNHCVAAGVGCVYVAPTKRRRTLCSAVSSIELDTVQSVAQVVDRDLELGNPSQVLVAGIPSDFLSQRPEAIFDGILDRFDDTELSDRTPLCQASPGFLTDLLFADTEVWESFLANPIFLSRPTTPVTSSLLDTHPQYRELWHHYTEVLCSLHTSHDKSTNPIIKILSPVAQSSDSLLAVLLACSLENYRSLRGLGPDEELLTTLINVAVRGVQKELANVQDGHSFIMDTTLATVIALCDFEVVARKRATTSSWRVHLDGAKHIISLRGGPETCNSATELYRFLLKWLAYFDIMSSMTSTEAFVDPLFQGNYWLQSGGHDGMNEDEYKLDPYMGFLQDIVPFFKEIGDLARIRNGKGFLTNLREASLLHKRCRTIENSLKQSLGTVSGHNWMGAGRLAVLTECHDAFVYSTLVHLYRRVEGIPSEMSDVQFAVNRGLQHIVRSSQKVPSDVDSSLLFPLFTFGCETSIPSDKELVLDKLKALGALGLGNVDRAIEVLLAVWERHHSEGHALEWDEILKLFNWEVNLA